MLGTLLNPLNSSMIAVALVTLQQRYDVDVATSSWLISSFYLAAAVGQPLMGRLVDLVGPRRMFVSGLAVVLLVCSLVPLVPGFWWLVALRAAQGIGTSAAYPAAVAIFRQAVGPDGKPPAGAMAALGMIAGGSAALGPVIGGLLLAMADWQAIFLINIPLAGLGIVLALGTLPAIGSSELRGGRAVAGALDIPGALLFAGFVGTTLGFLLSLAQRPLPWLLVPATLLGVGLVLVERSVPSPFLDVRGLVANRASSSILLQQVGIQLVFYAMFFGLPLWMETTRGLTSAQVGLLMLPFTVIGLLVTPLAARTVNRHGSRRALIAGSALLCVGTLMVQLLDARTTIPMLIVLACVMGIPNGLNSLALQTAMFAASPANRIGASGGLFQTCRYLGAILAGSVLGVLLERDPGSAGLHQVGWLITIAAVLLVLLATLLRRGSDRIPQAGVDHPPNSDSSGPRAK